ncbi:MAG TPA: phosphopantetheine-binding protein [Candidatus Acidoferrales bacterium]|nr:phosphopantetheine-binding protein [Candidatus Acidoferrales bacterium]
MAPSTRDRVVEIVRQALGADAVPDGDRLDLNSLQMIEIVVALENEFAISIPEEAPLARITASISSMVRYVEKAKS